MIYFITGNKNKLSEAKSILGENKVQGLNLELSEIQDIDPHKIIKTKLSEARKLHPGPFFVEDTSLCLEALNGLPGPLIKWFEKAIGNDGIFNLTQKLGNDRATAKNIIGFLDENNEIHFFEGEISGRIVSPRGENAFGWDPIFQPNGYKETFAEMNAKTKNMISHRRLALEKMKEYLNK